MATLASASLFGPEIPVTLFGALQTKTGWAEIAPVFEWVASRFSNCESFEYEVIAAGASGDLAYIVGVEHTTASVGDGAPEPYALRVKTVFRREDGEWKAVHRHGDADRTVTRRARSSAA